MISRRGFLVGSFGAVIGATLLAKLPAVLEQADPNKLFGNFKCPYCGHKMTEPVVEELVRPSDFGVITRGLLSCPACLRGNYWAFVGTLDQLTPEYKNTLRDHMRVQMTQMSKARSYAKAREGFR